MIYPLVVQEGSVGEDAVVRIDAAFNDPLVALVSLTRAYEKAWRQISSLVVPPDGGGRRDAASG